MSKKSAEHSRSERARAAMEAQAAAERRRNLLVTGAVAAVLAIVVVVGFLAARGGDTTGDEPSATPRGVDGYSVVIGDADAPDTITVYEDLQCPVCAAYEDATAGKVEKAVERGDVKVDYRMLAFLDRASTTDYSSRALNALMVVLDSSGDDAFMKMHRLLFEHQPAEGSAGLSDDQLVEYAVQAGADEDAVRGPIEDEKFAQWVVNATDQMSREGVTGTPTVLIDGKPAGDDPAASARAVLDLVG
jgi:protein-disulfide isomerase